MHRNNCRSGNPFVYISLQQPILTSHFVTGKTKVGRLENTLSIVTPLSVVELYLVGSCASISVSSSKMFCSLPVVLCCPFVSEIATGVGWAYENDLPWVVDKLESPAKNIFELLESIAHKSMSYFILLQRATLSPPTVS